MLFLTVASALLGAIIVNHRNEVKYKNDTLKQIKTINQTNQQKLDEDKKTIEDLKKQLQTKAKARQDSLVAKVENYIAPAVEAAPTPPVVPQTYSLPDNAAKAYIYMHESGNNPTRWNTSGCLGLGQACPASKLLAVCPTMDYGCEDNWFTNYAISRYGGWQGAYSFWLKNRYW